MKSVRRTMLLMTAIVGCLGCQERGPDMLRLQEPHYPEAVNKPDRMLGALVEHDQKAWSFKVSGPKADIDAVEPAFMEFLASIKFGDDPPVVWVLPKGWQHGPEKGGRFANLLADRPGIEVSVFELSKGGAATLPNVNRWRGQMGLTKTVPDYLDENVKDIVVGGEKAKLVDIAGVMQAKGGMMPPAQPKARADKRFTYDLPKGWAKTAPTKAFVQEQFTLDNNPAGLCTISLFPGDGGGIAANIQRWRDSLRLPKVGEAELAQDVVKIDTQSGPAAFVDLINPKEQGGNRILGAIVPGRESTAFLKLIGPADFVGQQKDRFEEFTKSFKFE